MASPPAPGVSMEVTDEMLKSMEVGLAFRDYVSCSSSYCNILFTLFVSTGLELNFILLLLGGFYSPFVRVSELNC